MVGSDSSQAFVINAKPEKMKSQSVLSWFDSNGFDAFEAHFNLNAFKVRIFAKIIGKNFIKLIC